MRTWQRMTAVLMLALIAGACDEADEITGEEDHTPVNARLFVNGQEITPAVRITRAQTTRFEIRFFAQDGDRITGIEADHFARLTFSPASLATSTDVASQRFFKDVTSTATAGTTGTVSVGYGHDTAASDRTFGPFNVTIQ
jgi:hypothetical protein